MFSSLFGANVVLVVGFAGARLLQLPRVLENQPRRPERRADSGNVGEERSPNQVSFTEYTEAGGSQVGYDPCQMYLILPHYPCFGDCCLIIYAYMYVAHESLFICLGI